MRNDLLGIIFPNVGDELMQEMTGIRCLGSVPFGGRYRLIDFQLSNLVNAGVSKVGITARSNYRSLMDHLGSGKPWDLSRKKGGIYFFPPFINNIASNNANRVSELASLMPFFEKSHEEYIVMTDCDCVANIDFEAMADEHIRTGADITIAYAHGQKPRRNGTRMVMNLDDDNRISEILLDPEITDECDYSVNIVMMKRTLIISLVKEALSRNFTSFARDIFQSGLKTYRIFGYKIEGYVRIIDSIKSYLAAHMELSDREVRNSLFSTNHPVFTKIADEMPARYGIGASVKNSLIADGCLIEGDVENCVLFRGVKIGKNAKLKNCVIMQGSEIGEGAEMSYVITDKSVKISSGRILMGFESYPAFISKESVV